MVIVRGIYNSRVLLDFIRIHVDKIRNSRLYGRILRMLVIDRIYRDVINLY